MFPPLSLAWVASIARQAGHDVTIIDARTLHLTKQDVLKKLRDFNPDILGFMMTTYMFPETLEWIRFLKTALNVLVVIGGYNLRVYPRESVSHPEIDFGVIEHALETVPLLFEAIEKKQSFEKIPGLAYKKDGVVTVNPPQPVNFENFPFPARDLLPNHLYAEFPCERKNFTVMVTSLGCPYGCSFCEAGRTPFNPRSAKKVVDEMQECAERFHIREIDFFDYDFTADEKRVVDICEEIRRRRLDIAWACRSRININLAVLKTMRAAGCSRIYFGIESGSQRILDAIRKNITLEKIRDTIRSAQSLGIRCLGFFLIGAPGESKTTVRETIRFAKALDLDYVQFSKCLAKPLTPLWQQMIKESGTDYWQDWILGKETDRDLPRPWTELTNQEIDRLTRWAYISYYARPSFLAKALVRIRSWDEFKRKITAWFDMVCFQEKKSRAAVNFVAYHE
ncbi:MAG: B12-binding domain-containing radical SAM protein [Candidatus Omnitrophica bacterium]|nr:B12-binding domain-containing radical SAM protein [Candidatus Omnitrophota bacterium]